MTIDPDHRHKAQYNAIRESYPEHNLPTWDDMTDEQRQNVRDANDENDRYMRDLGNAISNGTELPHPLRDTTEK